MRVCDAQAPPIPMVYTELHRWINAEAVQLDGAAVSRGRQLQSRPTKTRRPNAKAIMTLPSWEQPGYARFRRLTMVSE